MTDLANTGCQPVCHGCGFPIDDEWGLVHYSVSQVAHILDRLEEFFPEPLHPRIDHLLNRARVHLERIHEISENFLDGE